MPNHIQNRLQIKGSKQEVKEVLKSISGKSKDGEKMQIDFNKIRPMPEGLMVEAHSGVIGWAEICTCSIDFSSLFSGPHSDSAKLLQERKYGTLADRLKAHSAMESITGKGKSVKDFTNEEFEMFIQCIKNVRDHGHTTWYEWSREHWGTKWNAYGQNDTRNTDDTIHFETAWSSPIKLISRLSSLYPNCEFTLSYADEDSGSNAGVISFKGGGPFEVYQPENQSKEAYEIYFDLHPDRKNDYKLVGDSYEYIDEDD